MIATRGQSSKEPDALSTGASCSQGQAGQCREARATDGGDYTSKPVSCACALCTEPHTPGLRQSWPDQSLHKGRSDGQKGLDNRTGGLAQLNQQTAGKGMPVPQGTAH